MFSEERMAELIGLAKKGIGELLNLQKLTILLSESIVGRSSP